MPISARIISRLDNQNSDLDSTASVSSEEFQESDIEESKEVPVKIDNVEADINKLFHKEDEDQDNLDFLKDKFPPLNSYVIPPHLATIVEDCVLHGIKNTEQFDAADERLPM
ncbi:unnamed protein product [Citrullus colocynthis]|uniref:Uncharacterized protein n=1 Tax=Citrullus colocynthis TaxID=252529 RepID=A0ABP0YZV6_9ROSI